MFLYVYFKALYSYIFQRKTTLFTTCLVTLSIPAHAQNIDNSRLCRSYEQELRAIDYQTSMTTQQARRFQQLSQMQQQAKTDASRYGCTGRSFSNRSASEECRYILSAQPRIETALRQIHRQAATPQQRRIRQAIYTDMRHADCRDPRSLEQLIKENRPLIASRKRNPQSYKKTKPIQQALVIETISTEDTEFVPVKATASVGKSPFLIPAVPNISHTKAAEISPPPVSKAIDYVPNPTIRRVGPAYVPAR